MAQVCAGLAAVVAVARGALEWMVDEEAAARDMEVVARAQAGVGPAEVEELDTESWVSEGWWVVWVEAEHAAASAAPALVVAVMAPEATALAAGVSLAWEARLAMVDAVVAAVNEVLEEE